MTTRKGHLLRDASRNWDSLTAGHIIQFNLYIKAFKSLTPDTVGGRWAKTRLDVLTFRSCKV